MDQLFQRGLAIAFFVFFLACGGYISARDADELPEWVKNRTCPPTDYCGVGSGQNLEAAEQVARANLIKGIEVKIESIVHSYIDRKQNGKNEEITSEFIAESSSYATQNLPDIQIVKTHNKGNQFFAQAQLRRAVVDSLIEEKGQQSRRDVENRVRYGDDQLNSKHIISALEEYGKALNTVRTAPRRYMVTKHEEGHSWPIVIERKITKIKNDLEVKAIHGNEQDGTYGDSLADSLVVQVHYQGNPLDSFPFWVTYKHGTGQLMNPSGEKGQEVSVSTNENGQAIFWVKTIKSLSRENHIRVTAKDLPISKRADFHYGSLFSTSHSMRMQRPVIYLNGSADEQGFAENSVIKVEVFVQEQCYLHLFEILADGHFGYIQSVQIEDKHQDVKWRILRIESHWVLQAELPLRATRGPGLETLLAITTQQKWIPIGEKLTRKGLIRELSSHEWQVGWTSYVVEKNQ